MSRTPLAGVATLLCLMTGPAGSAPILRAADANLFPILHSELQRNFQILSKQADPAYFMSYAVHDTRTALIQASVGALQRSDDSRAGRPPSRCELVITPSITHTRSAAMRGSVRASVRSRCR